MLRNAAQVLPAILLFVAAPAFAKCYKEGDEGWEAFSNKHRLEQTYHKLVAAIDWRLEDKWRECKAYPAIRGKIPQWAERDARVAYDCGKIKFIKAYYDDKDFLSSLIEKREFETPYKILDSNGIFQKLVFIRHDTPNGKPPRGMFQCDWHSDTHWTRTKILNDEVRRVEGTNIDLAILILSVTRYDSSPKPYFEF